MLEDILKDKVKMEEESSLEYIVTKAKLERFLEVGVGNQKLRVTAYLKTSAHEYRVSGTRHTLIGGVDAVEMHGINPDYSLENIPLERTEKEFLGKFLNNLSMNSADRKFQETRKKWGIK